MSKAVQDRRKAKQGSKSLFENKPQTKDKKLPPHAIRELVDKWGMLEKDARALPWNVGWARLYAFRNGPPVTPERRAELKADCAARMAEAAANEDYDSRDLGNLIQESLVFLDRGILARVAKGIVLLLEPPKPSQ